MSVNVSYKGTVHSYGVSRAMLVQNLKEEISSKQNLHQFQLMLGQVELLDKKPVIKYLFTTFALCYDNKEAAVEINDMTLSVTVTEQEGQQVFTEEATPEMTVGELKERISRQLSSTRGKLTLKKDGKEVPDGDLLQTHIGVKTLTVDMQDMQVTVSYEGRQYSMTTRSDMTVLEFRSLVSDQMGMPVTSDLRIVFNGRTLNYLDEIDDPEWLRWMGDVYGTEAASVVEKMREEKCVTDNRTLHSHGVTHDSLIEIIYGVPAKY